uniref:DNA-directed DNA polymerase n=1 Tax=viral metagenome TaxID=1070528 RepID=A0A6C0BKR3_9ZZZZ
MRSLQVHGYAWDEVDQGDSHCSVRAWCLNKDSEPVLLRIEDFPVFCYIELPMYHPRGVWDEHNCNLFREELRRRLQLDDESLKLNFYKRQKLYFYKNDTKYPMMFAQFKTLNKMRHCKNLLANPIEIPEIGMIMCRMHEVDIPVSRKLLTLTECEYSSWMQIDMARKVQDHEKISLVDEEYYVSYKTIRKLDVRWTTSPMLCAIDIETYSDQHKAFPNKYNAKHVMYMISVIFQKYKDPGSRVKYQIVVGYCPQFGNTNVINVQTEVEAADELSSLVRQYRPQVLTGYNIFNFDVPYILARLEKDLADLKPMGYLKDSEKTYVKEKIWESSAYGRQHLQIPMAEGIVSVDMYVNIKRDYKLNSYNLDDVSHKFLGRGKLDVTAEQMFIAYENLMNALLQVRDDGMTWMEWLHINCKDKRIEELDIPDHTLKPIQEFLKIAEYCDEDSVLVLDLMGKMNTWDGLVQMSIAAGVQIVTIFTSGQQIRCYMLLYTACFRSDIVIDKREVPTDSFEGGFVGDPIKGKHPFTICLDFNSLYPSIIRAYNLCFTTLVPPELHSRVPIEHCHVFEWEEKVKVVTSKGEGNALDATDDEDEAEYKIIKHHHRFVKAEIKAGILPKLCTDLTERRSDVRKKIMKPLQDENGDPRPDLTEQEMLDYIVANNTQLALKVINNSVYGFLSAENGMAALPEAAMVVTYCGRSLIKQANNIIETKYNGTIIYNDTDSTMFKLPFVNSNADCITWGRKLEKEISANLPKPLYLEFEKAGTILIFTKKRYSFWLIDVKTGEMKVEKKTGLPSLYNRGILLSRRDNCLFQRRVYQDILTMIFLDKTLLDVIYRVDQYVNELHSGSVHYSELLVTRSIGATYKNPNYFMKVFADELTRIGRPAQPGDRLQYLIVHDSQGREKVGQKMRIPETYSERLGTEAEEKIDYNYYTEKALMKPIEQMINVAYQQQLDGAMQYYKQKDIRRLFMYIYYVYNHQQLIQYALAASNNDYEQAVQIVLANPPHRFKTKYDELRKRFITRCRERNMRVTNKPIKDRLKLLATREKVVQSIREIGQRMRG